MADDDVFKLKPAANCKKNIFFNNKNKSVSTEVFFDIQDGHFSESSGTQIVG
jgi:hypothetical protein